MKRKAMACAAGLLVGLLCSVAATAQTYPTKTVKIIVPYQAGQGTDVAARYFAEQLSKSLGQTFYVDNKPGAGGNIGAEATSARGPRRLHADDGHERHADHERVPLPVHGL